MVRAYRNTFWFAALVFGLLFSQPAKGQAPPSYTVVALSMTSLNALNNNTQVVGQDANGNTLLYDFFANTYTNLGSIGTVVGINDSGQMALNNNGSAYRDTNGSLQFLPLNAGNPAQDGPFNGAATGINNAGQVIGNGINGSVETGAEVGAFVDTNGAELALCLTNSPDFPFSTYAIGINNSGNAVVQFDGFYSLADTAYQYNILAPLIQTTNPRGALLPPLPGPQFSFFYDGEYGSAYSQYLYTTGINDNNDVIGYWLTPNNVFRSYLSTYSAGNYANNLDLGTLGSGVNTYAYAINNSNSVVGKADADTNSPPTEHAFLYQSGTLYDLNSLIPSNSGWILNSAIGINSYGYIIGYGTRNGAAATFLLRPTVHGIQLPHGTTHGGAHIPPPGGASSP